MNAILTLLELDEREPSGEQVTFRRPMLDVSAAMAMLDLKEFQLRREIERGRIKWAFNLGVGARSHVQILVRSLANYNDRTIIQPATVEGVANMVLPPESVVAGTVRGTDLQFALNIRSQHVMRLLDAGLLTESGEKEPHAGRFGTPIFTRESVVRLLALRRLK